MALVMLFFDRVRYFAAIPVFVGCILLFFPRYTWKCPSCGNQWATSTDADEEDDEDEEELDEREQ
jgi:hypothetical protein